MRIVLTWGETPKDLDSHLVGKSQQNNLFHIYYSQKHYGGIASLDKDDTLGYGIETITLNIPASATNKFSYYVHNFSNQNAVSSNILAKSDAVVEVYTSKTATPKRFSVPSSGIGNLWKVFEIDPVSMKIIPLNIIKNQSNPSAVGGTSNYNLLMVSGESPINEEENDIVEIQSDKSNQIDKIVDEEENAEVKMILDDIFMNSKE